MGYKVVTRADSIGPHRNRLWTAEISYPEFVHNEIMTVRKFSRNTGSSRALPVEKVIEQLINDPVIPLSFGRNEKGMVATKELNDAEQNAARLIWLAGRDYAVDTARALAGLKVHKQFANRVMQPYKWMTMIVSATDFENFFALRTEKDVQPEMRMIATMMVEEYYSHTPTFLDYGEWHLPFIDKNELANIPIRVQKKISVARCAAVSYLRQNDVRSIEEWEAVHDKLVTSGHWSPFEHVAFCDNGIGSGNFTGWFQYRHEFVDERRFRKEDADRVIADSYAFLMSIRNKDQNVTEQ